MMTMMMMVTSAIATTMITSFKLNGAATLQSRKLPPQSCLKALGSDYGLISFVFFFWGGAGGRCLAVSVYVSRGFEGVLQS